MKSLRTEINVYTVVVYSFDMYSVRKLFIKLKHVDTIFVHNIKGKVFLHRIGGGVIVMEWCKISTLQPEKLYFARRLRVALRRLCIAFLQREYVWIIFFLIFNIWKKNHQICHQKHIQIFIVLKLVMPNDLKNTFESSHIKTHKVAGNCNQCYKQILKLILHGNT